jgi:hypothetical protein
VKELNISNLVSDRPVASSGVSDHHSQGHWMADGKTDDNEDEDAQIYKRAKNSVDELHRARKFEKSIKLK